MTKTNTEIREAVNRLIAAGHPKTDAITQVAKEAGVLRENVKRRLRAHTSRKIGQFVPDAEDPALMRRTIHDLELALAEQQEQVLDAVHVRKTIFRLKDYDNPYPAWMQKIESLGGSPGAPTLFLSDWHWGEVVVPEQVFGVNKFNSAIAKTRMEYCVQKAIRLLDEHIVHGKDIPGFVLCLGGDMVSGNIHEDLTVTNDSEMMAQTRDAYRVLYSAVEYIANRYKDLPIQIYGVPGNHGRTSKKPRAKFYAESNFDWLIYTVLEDMVKSSAWSKNIKFFCPPARDLTYTLAGHNFRLTHGDAFKGGDSMIGALGPVVRGAKKKHSQAMSLPVVTEHFDTMLVGHWHSYLSSPRIIMNGSGKGFDELALTNYGFDFEPPQQALFITHPRWGINYAMPVICDPGFDHSKRGKA